MVWLFEFLVPFHFILMISAITLTTLLLLLIDMTAVINQKYALQGTVLQPPGAASMAALLYHFGYCQD